MPKLIQKVFKLVKVLVEIGNNVNVNLAQGFDGDTNVNIEGKKQLNKYLDLTGSADTSGNYRAGIGFDFKF